MGNIISSTAEKSPYELLDASASNKISGLQADFRGICRILVVGPPGAGKSTIMTHMKIEMNNSLSDAELVSYRRAVYNTLTQVALGIVSLAGKGGLSFDDPANGLLASKLESVEPSSASMSEELLGILHSLNRDATTSLIVERHRDFDPDYPLPPSTRYLLNDIPRFGSPNYVPTIKDILRVSLDKRPENTETSLRLHNGRLLISEIPQSVLKAEDAIDRRRTAAIFYCVPLDDYDSPRFPSLLEDFKATVNSGWREHTEILLFLNRSDIFDRKLEKKPLNTVYPDYTGENNVKECAMYLWGKFRKRNRSGLELRCFVTNATSSLDTDYIIKLVKNQIVYTWLRKSEIKKQ